MRFILAPLRHKASFGFLYIANFVFAFHIFFTTYFNSSFLGARGLTEGDVSDMYLFGSLISLGALIAFPRVLRLLGAYRSILILSFFQALTLICLSIPAFAPFTFVFFVYYITSFPLIVFLLDVFLENLTQKEGRTGEIRGAFLTTTNTALVIAPLFAGALLTNYPFEALYALAAALLLPFTLIMYFSFRHFRDPHYEEIHIKSVLAEAKANRDVRNIYMLHFLLRIFFAFMVIYTPLYLHNVVGFSFEDIGMLLAIMLLPFALFELPLGKIADAYTGEKEILFVGFAILALSTALLSFITSSAFIVWAIVLFITRVGASAVEIMTESYFFKHIDGDDSDNIAIFRLTRPAGYVAAALLGALSLSIVEFRYLFIILALCMLIGLIITPLLRDSCSRRDRERETLLHNKTIAR
ncbi:hypothetical protein COU17_01385 [Candidatus Kaiserbacteria bacterium CG10_big_fil_rev_8_21_14_0_10_49_17]|uniref:Major facilitator superfamily (MFS) profile domain-containing protein n=1 Tax=Candidatus Kaiserbacteria bacterium CG10_big_fil_rev_8_21_14_0_10_49_17 TaxID=1974609 RepID=A0A2M6WER5_9BACT|nr:MAG: hypothetical protein COU17_01385 [Candidatus Kaiserbacteria bacterium CG10_big_fil_rev_8_21_14_0_10_49_17]